MRRAIVTPVGGDEQDHDRGRDDAATTSDTAADPGSTVPPGRPATLRDVAAAAGVGPSTVSRVLRNTRAEEFRPETRRAVTEAAARLGYRPNAAARGLRTRRTGAIALVVPDLDNFGFTQITRGAQEVLAERDVILLVLEAPAVLPDPSGHGLLGLGGRVDGVLVAFAHLDQPSIARWARPDLPVVLVQRGSPDAPSVVMAEERNAAAMVEHLTALGHRTVGHVAGDLTTETGRRRRDGFAAAAAASGIDSSRVAEGRFTRDGGDEAATALLTSATAPRPTALAVANLVSALGALSAARRLGLQVPEDLSVICIDEHLVAQHTDPPLTTVRTPQRELGRAAARAVLDAVDGKPVGRVTVDAAPVLVPRASTAGPPEKPTVEGDAA